MLIIAVSHYCGGWRLEFESRCVGRVDLGWEFEHEKQVDRWLDRHELHGGGYFTKGRRPIQHV